MNLFKVTRDQGLACVCFCPLTSDPCRGDAEPSGQTPPTSDLTDGDWLSELSQVSLCFKHVRGGLRRPSLWGLVRQSGLRTHSPACWPRCQSPGAAGCHCEAHACGPDRRALRGHCSALLTSTCGTHVRHRQKRPRSQGQPGRQVGAEMLPPERFTVWLRFPHP